jgi:CRISPR/Cas system-associated endonuclease/helicase Cas3
MRGVRRMLDPNGFNPEKVLQAVADYADLAAKAGSSVALSTALWARPS